MLIKSAKVPKVLFIKGAFKKDCLTDDIFDKKILENATIDVMANIMDLPDNDFVNYEKLPSVFTNIDSWVKRSNLLCWNCNLSFKTTPIFIPGVIEPSTTKNKTSEKNLTISVHGVFCYFGCALQYIETRNYTLSSRAESLNKLKLLHKLFYNKKIKELSYYPNPMQLKQFGGDLSTEEFESEKERCENR